MKVELEIVKKLNFFLYFFFLLNLKSNFLSYFFSSKEQVLLKSVISHLSALDNLLILCLYFSIDLMLCAAVLLVYQSFHMHINLSITRAMLVAKQPVDLPCNLSSDLGTR